MTIRLYEDSRGGFFLYRSGDDVVLSGMETEGSTFWADAAALSAGDPSFRPAEFYPLEVIQPLFEESSTHLIVLRIDGEVLVTDHPPSAVGLRYPGLTRIGLEDGPCFVGRPPANLESWFSSLPSTA